MTFESPAASSFAAVVDTADRPTPTARARQKAGPLTDTALKALKPTDKAYKVTDGAGMYVVVTPAGSKSFRFDYRLDGKRQTLTIGQYEPATPNRNDAELQTLDYGAVLSLKDARALRDRASRQVAAGENPSKAKVHKRASDADDGTFGAWAAEYIKFKSDPKSGEEQWAESTLDMKRSIYRRLLEGPLAKRWMGEIKRAELRGRTSTASMSPKGPTRKTAAAA